MNFSDLCGFVVFAAFLFSAIKPNPEKQPIEAFGWTKNIIDTNDFRGGKRAFEFLSREGREGGEVRRTGISVAPATPKNLAPLGATSW